MRSLDHGDRGFVKYLLEGRPWDNYHALRIHAMAVFWLAVKLLQHWPFYLSSG